MLVLDTHALIWLVEGSRSLGRRGSRSYCLRRNGDSVWFGSAFTKFH